MTTDNPVVFHEVPARLSTAEIDELTSLLPKWFVAVFPVCGRCDRPLILLGVKHEPVVRVVTKKIECRVCTRGDIRRASAKRRAK